MPTHEHSTSIHDSEYSQNRHKYSTILFDIDKIQYHEYPMTACSKFYIMIKEILYIEFPASSHPARFWGRASNYAASLPLAQRHHAASWWRISPWAASGHTGVVKNGMKYQATAMAWYFIPFFLLCPLYVTLCSAASPGRATCSTEQMSLSRQ